VSLNTYDLSVRAARAAIEKARRQTGLPATDPVRFDAGPVVEAIDAFHRKRVRALARRAEASDEKTKSKSKKAAPKKRVAAGRS
jgi:hypothetical protein